MQTLIHLFAQAQAWVFETIVSPALYFLDLASLQERAFEATEFFLLGVLEILFIALVLQTLERVNPVELSASKPRRLNVDLIYTALNRLGAAPLLIFAILAIPFDVLDGWLRIQGFIPPKLEDFIPAMQQNPIMSFIIYLLVIDFCAYWLHRAQHQFEIWWALHSLHHSQERMTVWTDDRNHLLDDLLVDGAFAIISLIIGIPPAQFVVLVMVSRLVESFSHANLRISFGAVGERLVVSPRFHRVHHAIGLGHEGKTHGVNFAVLFPIWDVIFKTANFANHYPATGVRDQQQGVNYGVGFWQQQWYGVKRLVRVVNA